MRIIIVLLSFQLIFATTKAQTTPAQTTTKPIRIKSYSLPEASEYNSWDIGAHIGIAYPYTDISGSGLNFAFGLDGTKFLTHSFALQARFIHASLSGEDFNQPDFTFSTTINYDFTLNALFQFGNISFLKRIPNLALYTSIGIGVINYTPDVYIDGGSHALNGIYSQYAQPLDTMDYGGTSDLMIPLGIGAKYRINDILSLTAEYSYRSTNSDKLDGFYKLLSDHDNYSYFGVGVTYHLGHEPKSLEWENPLQTVYNDLYDMKEKVDQMGKDSDGDGVADLYDKEPGTPVGSKVYGDGTSVDTDGDGVPDINDAEPFSEKNAKVDASGINMNPAAKPVNTINTEKGNENVKRDSDGDGVSDLYDKDPNTPFGSKVYGDGTSVDTDGDGVPDYRDSEIFSEKNARVDASGKDTNPKKTAPVELKTPDSLNQNPPNVSPAINGSDLNKKMKNDEQPNKNESGKKSKTGNASSYENYSNLPSVYFAIGEDQITSKNNKTLDYIAHVMQYNPDVKFMIIGNCDAIGTEEYNNLLAKSRAEAVKNYLVSKHRINTSRLFVKSNENTDEIKGANPMNRRVDIKVRE